MPTDRPQPAFVLVRPQMGENIGAAARAMWNFGLDRMRIVAPRDGWPNPKAVAMASGAGRLLDEALLCDGVPGALEDCHYVMATTARARGLTNRAVHFGHALKNTLIPVITITGLQLGSLIAFAIITETVFRWPGMGSLFLQAIQFVDIPVMSTYLIVVAFIFVVLNLIVDILYYTVDPRLRVERTGGGH